MLNLHFAQNLRPFSVPVFAMDSSLKEQPVLYLSAKQLAILNRMSPFSIMKVPFARMEGIKLCGTEIHGGKYIKEIGFWHSFMYAD